jgi:hypothetical protein
MALIGAKRLGALGLSPNGWNQSRNFPVFFPVIVTGNFNAENQFAQACVHRQTVLEILSPGSHCQQSIEFAGRKAENAAGMGPYSLSSPRGIAPSVRFFSAGSLTSSLSLESGNCRTSFARAKGIREFELTVLLPSNLQ